MYHISLYPLITPNNRRLPDVFNGYRSRTLTWLEKLGPILFYTNLQYLKNRHEDLCKSFFESLRFIETEKEVIKQCFFYQLFGRLNSTFRPLMRIQPQSHNAYHSFCFLNLTRHNEVGFQRTAGHISRIRNTKISNSERTRCPSLPLSQIVAEVR